MHWKALERDFRQSKNISSLYGNWAAEAQRHGVPEAQRHSGLTEKMSVQNSKDVI